MPELKLRYDPDVYIAAAQLRVATDKRLGVETEDIIVRLAEGDLGEVGEWLKSKNDGAIGSDAQLLHTTTTAATTTTV